MFSPCRSPELNNLKPHKPVVISSEFPSCQDEQGQSKGGMLLFKLDTKQKKGKGSLPKELKVQYTVRSLSLDRASMPTACT